MVVVQGILLDVLKTFDVFYFVCVRVCASASAWVCGYMRARLHMCTRTHVRVRACVHTSYIITGYVSDCFLFLFLCRHLEI